MYFRLTLVVFTILGAVSGIAALFWHVEYQYKVPTEIPENYSTVHPGNLILTTNTSLGEVKQPLFLHFYNPDCPCTRFNIKHLRQLISEYNGVTQITLVVQSSSDKEKAASEFGPDVNYVIDTDHSLARACGVYSTPQAVIIDEKSKLYFRGNYNQSRYCTARATNYAELALLSFLNNNSPPVFDLAATQSYGCELKGNNPYLYASQP